MTTKRAKLKAIPAQDVPSTVEQLKAIRESLVRGWIAARAEDTAAVADILDQLDLRLCGLIKRLETRES